MNKNTRLSADEKSIPIHAWNADQAVNHHVKRILVVDDDLGFVLWLAGILVGAGYAAYPAESAGGALKLAGKLEHNLDLLAVNPRITRVTDLANRLKCNQPGLKVVALLDEKGPPSVSLPLVDGTFHKPVQSDRHTASRIVHWIDHLLTLNRAA